MFKNHLSPKISIPIIIIIAAIALSIGCFAFFNYEEIKWDQSIIKGKRIENEENNIEEIDTSNWKIYKDDKYGLIFKYPNNWNCRIDMDQKPQLNVADRIILCIYNEKNIEGGTLPSININIITTYEEKTVLDWYKKIYKENEIPKEYNYDIAKTNGIKIYYREGNPPTIQENEGLKVVLIKNNKLFDIDAHIDELGIEKLSIENIIDSFIVK